MGCDIYKTSTCNRNLRVHAGVVIFYIQKSIVPIVCQTSSIFHFLKESPQEWNGQLAEAATSILQQHAMQGDLTELQVCLTLFT